MGASNAIARGFQYGLLIFVLTALLGLANATKIWGDLSRDQLLTHLHAGTLGWITLGVFAIAAWIFGAASPSLGRYLAASAVATAAYVLAFWSGNFAARAIFGAIELVVIYAWWGWTGTRAVSEGLARISVPKLSVALGLTTLVVGSTLGVIVQAQLALNQASQQTGNLISAHAGAQVGGYLVLVAAGIIEWQLLGERAPSRAGQIQAVLLFLSGVALSVGLLLNVSPLLLVQIVCQVAGIAIVAFIVVLLAVGSSAGAGAFAHPVAYTAPIMGLAALLGVVTFLQRLQPAREPIRAPVPA